MWVCTVAWFLKVIASQYTVTGQSDFAISCWAGSCLKALVEGAFQCIIFLFWVFHSSQEAVYASLHKINLYVLAK